MPNSDTEKHSMMPTTISPAPRIYYLYLQFAGPSTELDTHLDRCAALGFSDVMVQSAFLADAGLDKTSDAVRPGGEPQASRSPGSSIDALARSCSSRNLKLLVDFDVGEVDLQSLNTDASISSGRIDDDPPDPRRPLDAGAKKMLDLARPDVAEAVFTYWIERLRKWTHAGAAGFCCRSIGDVEPSFWRDLIVGMKQTAPAIRMMAWTPGCSPEQLARLPGCGFDATFSSAAWWNYRAGWLVEEHARLARIAPPIAFPDSPLAPVIHRLDDRSDEEIGYRAHRRALRLAAAAGHGLLVPMGFEFGLSGAMKISGGTPDNFIQARKRSPFDLSNEIAEANATVARLEETVAAADGSALSLLTMAESNAAALLRQRAGAGSEAGEALLIVANAHLSASSEIDLSCIAERARGFVRYEALWPAGGQAAHGQTFALEPGEVRVFAARRMPPVVGAVSRARRLVDAASRIPRIAIEAVTPSVDAGQFPVKRTVGELVTVEADAFIDGHDKLGVALLWRAADDKEWNEARMHLLGNDRWSAAFPLLRVGRHSMIVEAWRDAFATYRDELEKKVRAGLDVTLELEEGRLLAVSAAENAAAKGLDAAAATLTQLAEMLRTGKPKRSRKAASEADAAVAYPERITAILSAQTAEAMRLADARAFAIRSAVLAIDAERVAARFSSWYELFPRSQSGDPKRHGTFADVEKRLPAIRDMGFDTLYFPPIHPIGKKNRKGRNNSLTPTESDPGSPYAIGSPDGGHDAIHPELGTLQDFRHLRDEAARHGLELALDFAIQCSPDHPWLRQHPEWFAWRPDGSIRYAENPPKKYEDIVNVDFYAEGAIPDLWIALRDAVLFWVKEGVRVFRVDNPHTKPLPFWQWMIGDIRARFPDTIFLSEAFTRPKMMYRLAKVGFSQSYTYFTWRHTKAEFTEYLTELTTTSVRDYFRPHFFVNTPDINPVFLQQSGRPGFLIRAALATTLSGLWGMYSGFELCEATPVPGKEDYLDSEKYEIRAWDWQRPGNIIQEISVLNRIRTANPALQTHLGVRFHPSSSDHILCYTKSTPHPIKPELFGDNVVLVAINLDPFAVHESGFELPLWRFGLPDDGTLEVDDLVNGNRFTLRGKMQHLRLDPFVLPYAVWRIRPQGA